MILTSRRDANLNVALAKPGIILLGDAYNPNANDTFLADNAAISSLKDMRFYQNIGQATGSKQPTYKLANAGSNLFPSISFDGTQQSLQVSGLNSLIGAVDKTIIFIINPTTTSGSRWLLDTNSSTNRLVLTINAYDDSNGHNPTFTATTGWQALTFDFAGSTGTVYRNNTQIATGSYTSKAFGATTGIGADSGATFARFQGFMAAVIIGLGLSSTARQQIARFYGNRLNFAVA